MTEEVDSLYSFCLAVPATIDIEPKTTPAKVSNDVWITCVAVGNLPIELWWFNGTKQLSGNSRVAITTFSESKFYRINSTLIVRRLVLEDTRQYSCRVRNAFGDDEKTFRIIAQRKSFLILTFYFLEENHL